ncbi:hypothetical protein BDZ45DRAFT_699003 [Acephala macrosclerotiorum]|nr:hypothetical protein BDZ45DRAFT_699003 [Acephala macrosclerotiorum]
MPEDAHPQPPSFAIHYNRPISVSFLDRWRGREKPNKEAVMIEGMEESYDLEHHRIRPSEGFRQTCTSQSFPPSGVSAANPAAGVVRHPAASNLAQIRAIKTNTKRAAARKLTRKRLDASSTSGAARQKPGRVAMRHFSDWLPYCNACRPSPAASQSPRDYGMRIRDSATARQIESTQRWLSSYLSQCEADLKRLSASQRVRSIEI